MLAALKCISVYQMTDVDSYSDDTLSHLPSVKQTQSVNQLMFIFLFTRRQTEIALAMTRYLTCQVLNRRNQGINYKMPNLKAFMRPRGIEQEPEKGKL